jgi:anti-anti-sigma factor
VPPFSRDLPASELLVTLEWREKAAVLRVTGEIDLVSAPEFDDVVTGVVADAPAVLVVDLRSVTFLCSAGLQVLAAAHRRLGERDLRVVSDSAVTTRPLTTTGLDEWIAVFPTLEQALDPPAS